MLMISIITIIYSWQGGMKAVVWGDAVQMILLFGGLITCLLYGINLLGDLPALDFDATRLQVIDFNWGFENGAEYGIVPMLVGGFFLYASYYGCDQTQAQRLLSAKDEKTIRQLLLANGVLRFPVVLTYCLMGLVLGSFAFNSPDFMAAIVNLTKTHFPEEYAKNGIKPDLMLPVFIMNYLPHGIIGLLMVAILSAAMSSLSSAINSLAAVTVEDFYGAKKDEISNEQYMRLSKQAVVFWGVACIGAAYLFGGSDSPVIEIINAISSVFNGPILATFLLAILSKKINSTGMNVAIIVAVAINLLFSKTIQDMTGLDLGIHIFWIWLNFTGFISTVAIAYFVSYFTAKDSDEKLLMVNYKLDPELIYNKETYLLIGFFVLIIAISFTIPYLL